jgi:5-formyltetrahydrofolate cyclo-ligase
MRDARAAVAPEERSRLIGAVEVRLFSVPEVHAARTVLLFYAFGSEVGTAGMADRAVRAGKRLLLPYLEGGAMEAAEVLPGDRLVPTDYGPKEPSRRVPVDPGEVDVVVTPGLAFDGVGRRLGYGKGFYDRYLRRLRPEAVRVGIGFSIQMVDEVPADPSDERVHLVVTDAEVIDCRKGRAGPL